MLHFKEFCFEVFFVQKIMHEPILPFAFLNTETN